jgi:hypothetical protein
VDIAKPYGPASYRCVDAGWLEVSHLGRLHVVFSRQGMAKMILGLVTDDPEPSRRELPHFFSVSLHPGMQTDAHHEKEAA